MSREPSIAWIRELARPYLRGYRPRIERRGSLRGWRFTRSVGARGEAGFFVGYLVAAEGYEFLTPQPPECVVFAFVHPVGGALHRRLVRAPGSLLRKTFEYIRWLTHRPPRFTFYADQPAAMVRHTSMREWPRAKYEHFSRNFFIETLAWLVRSALVRKLGATPPHGRRASESRR